MNIKQRIETQKATVLPILTALLASGHYTVGITEDSGSQDFPNVIYRPKGRNHPHSKFQIACAVEDAIELANDLQDALEREADFWCSVAVEIQADERAEGEL